MRDVVDVKINRSIPCSTVAISFTTPEVVKKYFPEYREIYSRLGWTMFDSIDRVYDPGKAAKKLDFICRESFAGKLKELQGSFSVG